KWRRTIPAFAQKFNSAWALRPNSCLSTCPNSGHSYTHPGGIGAMVQAGAAAKRANGRGWTPRSDSRRGPPSPSRSLPGAATLRRWGVGISQPTPGALAWRSTQAGQWQGSNLPWGQLSLAEAPPIVGRLLVAPGTAGLSY